MGPLQTVDTIVMRWSFVGAIFGSQWLAQLLGGGMPRERENATLRRMDGLVEGQATTVQLLNNGDTNDGRNKGLSTAVRHGIGPDPSFSP